MADIFEFRGVDNLVYAKLISDSNGAAGGLMYGDVKPLSPVAEIGRTTETSSESHYYDNKPMIVISSTGSDELSLTVAPLGIATLADITGYTFDEETGTMIEGERKEEYFALGYRTKGTDGKYRYVWRFKGRFNIPDETSATEDDGTTTNNTQLTWTGISTTHTFEKTGASARAIVCDERQDKLNLSVFTFLTDVITPDTLDTLKKTTGE